MSCPKSILLSAYLDNELQGPDKTALEAHVTGCETCSAALSEMRSLQAAFAQAERHTAPLGFAARVMARTAELSSPSPYPLFSGERTKPALSNAEGARGWFVPLSIRFAEAAALLLVITVGILAGTVMMNGSSTEKVSNIASSFSLDLFDATPQGSLGGAYLAMTEVRNEK